MHYATPLPPPGPPPQIELLFDIRSYPLVSQLNTTRLVLTAQSALLYPPPLCAQSSPSPCVSPLWAFVARPTPQMSLPPPSQPPQPFVLLAWVMHTWVIAPWTAVLKRHVGKKQACRAERWSLSTSGGYYPREGTRFLNEDSRRFPHIRDQRVRCLSLPN